MKILIVIGMVIIFISAFFIMFIFDTVVKNQIRCMSGLEEGRCDLKSSASSLVLGMALIAMFLIVDSGVLYLIIKSITSSGSSYIAYNV
jgi:uncharacterized membrane protein